MENFASLFDGFSHRADSFQHVLMMVAGVLLGILVGVLPGLGAPNGVSLLLPLTFSMDPVSAIILLTSMYWGALFGGSTTSILFNIPGEPSSVATTFDGYPDGASRAAPREALTLAFLSAGFGALVGVVLITLLSRLGRAVRAALRLAGILRRLFPRLRELRRARRRARRSRRSSRWARLRASRRSAWTRSRAACA